MYLNREKLSCINDKIYENIPQTLEFYLYSYKKITCIQYISSSFSEFYNGQRYLQKWFLHQDSS